CQCEACEECGWPQDGLAGLPVAANSAHVWIAGRLVPTRSRDCGFTFLSATSADVDRVCSGAHSTHAKSIDADESATGARGVGCDGPKGMRIIRAIVTGERNPQRLAEMRDWRTKSDEETVAKALEGNYL